MFTTTLIAPEGALSPTLAEALRNAWGGGDLRWLAPDEAAEFDMGAVPGNRWEVWEDLQRARVDLVVQRTEGRRKRMLLADMDSTIIQQEVIDELARRAGKYDEVSAVTEAAMRGEMDFDESLRQRCEHLKGLPDSVFGTVYRESIDLTPGADRFVQVTGCRCHGHCHSHHHHHHLRLTSSIPSFRCCKSSASRWRSSPEGSRTSPTW